MALTDWTEQAGGGRIAADDTHVAAGSLAMRIRGGRDGGPVALTNDQSETDSPTEGRIVTEAWWQKESAGTDQTAGGVGFIFRWQDPDNYYMLVMGLEADRGADGGEERLYFVKRVGGAQSTLGRNDLGTAEFDEEVFNTYRATFWEDGGSVFARLEEDDGTGFDVLGPDLSDASPDFGGGGAMGLGQDHDVHNGGGMLNASTWFDETELFY